MNATTHHELTRPTTVSCRALRPSDRTDWARLWAGYQHFYRVNLDPTVTATLWQRLLDPDQQPDGLVAIDTSGRLVGLVHHLRQRSTWLIEDQIYLADLYVDPEQRCGGAGRALIRAVDDHATGAGLSRVHWLTQADNDTARRLYDQVATVTPFIMYQQNLPAHHTQPPAETRQDR